ncbi:hypothetical protein N9U83_01230 [Candidatus Pelagibacter sp.]|nr:hypothetical protein [Candidatus Pelagibacter sp.]
MNNIYYCDKITLLEDFNQKNFKLIKKNLSLNLSSSQFLKINGLIVTPFTEIDNSKILKMKNLKFIFIMGLHKLSKINLFKLPQNIKILYFEKKKNLNTLNKITPTPEFIIGLILILARNINYFFLNKKKLHRYINFDRNLFFDKMISNSTLGVIGYGRVGKKLSEYALNFGMKVIVYAPKKFIKNKKIEKVDKLSSLAKKADFISNNASSNKNNYHFLNKNFFKYMKKNSFFINTAKGEHVNINDLSKTIIKKKILGAAIDVYEEENQNIIFNNKNLVKALKTNNNFILSPHIAGATISDRLKLQKRMIYLINSFLKNHKLEL